MAHRISSRISTTCSPETIPRNIERCSVKIYPLLLLPLSLPITRFFLSPIPAPAALVSSSVGDKRKGKPRSVGRGGGRRGPVLPSRARRPRLDRNGIIPGHETVPQGEERRGRRFLPNRNRWHGMHIRWHGTSTSFVNRLFKRDRPNNLSAHISPHAECYYVFNERRIRHFDTKEG